jgi:hypothetical protein
MSLPLLRAEEEEGEVMYSQDAIDFCTQEIKKKYPWVIINICRHREIHEMTTKSIFWDIELEVYFVPHKIDDKFSAFTYHLVKRFWDDNIYFTFIPHWNEQMDEYYPDMPRPKNCPKPDLSHLWAKENSNG